jgi:hypothetical protein
VSSPVAVEGDQETFTVTLSQQVNATVSVSYQTVAGSAAAGTDYATKTGTLTFSPDTTSQTVTVPTQLDAKATSDLGFSLALGTPSVSGGSATINGGGNSGTATIEEVKGAISFYNPNGTPNDGTVDFGGSVPMTVRLTSPGAVDGQFMLSYDTSCYEITTDAAGNNVVIPGTTTFTASTGGTQLYLWGLDSSSDPAAAQINLEYVEGDPQAVGVATTTAPAVTFLATGTMKVSISPRPDSNPMWRSDAVLFWYPPRKLPSGGLPFTQVSFLQCVLTTCTWIGWVGGGVTVYNTGKDGSSAPKWRDDTPGLLAEKCLTAWVPGTTLLTSSAGGKEATSHEYAELSDDCGQNAQNFHQIGLTQEFEDVAYVSSPGPNYGQVLGYIQWGITVTCPPSYTVKSIFSSASPLAVLETKYWISGPDLGSTYSYRFFVQGAGNMLLTWGGDNGKPGYAPPARFIAFYAGLGASAIPLK